MHHSLSIWTQASRPKTLAAGFVPIMVGLALTLYLQLSVDMLAALLTIVLAIALQIGINLVNDALDFKHGVDTKDRIGPVRATQQGLLSFKQVMAGGCIAFALALLCAALLAFKSGSVIFAITLVCVAMGYLYSGGPYPLSYLGLSDPAVVIFFGIIATGTTVYIQTQQWPADAIVAGLQIGFLATVLSAINNLRDITQDRIAGKRTLPVRLGVEWARLEIAMLLVLPFALGIYWCMQGLAWVAVLPLLVVPLAGYIGTKVFKEPPSPFYNSLLAKSALLLLLFGILLSLALILSI
jgi:1,4-dihydroxy-2-naphthoate octaprenyltransferase